MYTAEGSITQKFQTVLGEIFQKYSVGNVLDTKQFGGLENMPQNVTLSEFVNYFEIRQQGNFLEVQRLM
jgi:hypothetical protein